MRLGSSPRGIAAVGSGVVGRGAGYSPRPATVGGTLTDVNQWLPDPDPTLGYAPFCGSCPNSPFRVRQPGHLEPIGRCQRAHPRAGPGHELPRPTDGGMTYTFTLRRGIRYSNGTLVRASDIRRGIVAPAHFGLDSPGLLRQHLLVRRRAHTNPRRCDLSAGIVTNDTAGTITFHLSWPNPDFLDILTLLIAAPVPPGTPDHAIRAGAVHPRHRAVHDLAATSGTLSLTLVRNPYFRQWSYAAHPAGYPDVIRFELDSQFRQTGSGGGRRPGRTLFKQAENFSQPLLTLFFFLPSGTQPAASRIQRRHLLFSFSTPASRRSRTSRRGRHSTTPSIAPGLFSCSVSAPLRPRRHARSSRLTSPATKVLLPLHNRRPERGLAWPGYGQGPTACRRIRHDERAGDRVDLQRPGGRGGELLPCPAPQRTRLQGEAARGVLPTGSSRRSTTPATRSR